MKRKNERKKGIIFSLDGAIATTIVIIMLINTTYYFSTTAKESISQIQVVKRGYDVVTMFDVLGDLEEVMNQLPMGTTLIPEDDSISYSLNASIFLSRGYDMLIEVYDAHETVCNDCVVDTSTTVAQTTPVLEGGYKHVEILVNFSYFAPPYAVLEVETGGIGSKFAPLKCIRQGSECLGYHTTTLEPLLFSPGTNNLEFRSLGPGAEDYQIQYYKVLNDRAYLASTSTTEHQVPKNKFVGSGERWFSSFNGSMFEGIHKVKFYIWIRPQVTSGPG